MNTENVKEFKYEYTVPGTDRTLLIRSGEKMFSPRMPDRGTLAMLSACRFECAGKVLDLGCGAGLVGLAAAAGGAEVTMCDINPEAVGYALNNAKDNLSEEELSRVEVIVSDGFGAVTKRNYDMILSNPPYHTDFSVAKRFIEGAFSHLKPEGYLYMVTKRLDWYRNKITAIFGGVKVTVSDGYFVFTAQKRDTVPHNVRLKRQKGSEKR